MVHHKISHPTGHRSFPWWETYKPFPC
jgi:hypothetical protein